LLKVKQIVLLRKLRFSVPSIQEIFTSAELTRVIAVFTKHLDETERETEQMAALGTVLRQLLLMLKDRQDVESVYQYLETAHGTESAALKEALQTVLSTPPREIAAEAPPEQVVDMRGIDMSLAALSEQDMPDLQEIIKQCYPGVADIEKLLYYWDWNGFRMPDCRWFYKIMQDGQCVGAVNLAYTGMESMLIRCLACTESDNNVYIFALLKQLHPQILCWNLYYPNDESDKEDFCFDWVGQKRRFGEDNGFAFYTDARWNRYIKMMVPHDELYNSSRYRFGLLDGSMDGVAFRFFGAQNLDWYDGRMIGWRVTDCNFNEALIYDTAMENSKFYDTTLANGSFFAVNLSSSAFDRSSFVNCALTECDIAGMTVDGVNVQAAVDAYRRSGGGGCSQAFASDITK